MFPLVHYHINRTIFRTVPPLMTLGGLWPDLAFRCGADRNRAHKNGEELYRWCQRNAPHALPLAVGVISHGSTPPGVDWLADKFWPGYICGWCFQQAEKYLAEVRDCTGLKGEVPLAYPADGSVPRNDIWWKAHNFVEIALELYVDAEFPDTGSLIIQDTQNKVVVAEAAEVLAAFLHCDAETIKEVFYEVPDIFALNELTCQRMAENQCMVMPYRFPDCTPKAEPMAALLRRIQQDLTPDIPDFLAKLQQQTANTLANYPLAPK